MYSIDYMNSLGWNLFLNDFNGGKASAVSIGGWNVSRNHIRPYGSVVAIHSITSVSYSVTAAINDTSGIDDDLSGRSPATDVAVQENNARASANPSINASTSERSL